MTPSFPDRPLSLLSSHGPPALWRAGFSVAVAVRGRPVATRESDWDARSRPGALLRGQGGARRMSVVFLAAEVERLALLPAFAAPRRLAGALAVPGHRPAGLAGHAGAPRLGIARGVAFTLLADPTKQQHG